MGFEGAVQQWRHCGGVKEIGDSTSWHIQPYCKLYVSLRHVSIRDNFFIDILLT